MILINKVNIDDNPIYNLAMTQRFNLTALLFITLVYASSAYLMRGGRELNVVSTTTPCNFGTNGSECICPGKCLTYRNSTGGCEHNDCWKWNTVTEKCEPDGKDFIAPMVLQSVPFTGIFGSGFGNIGRWDLFGAYMAVMFGPVVILCLTCCYVMAGGMSQDESQQDLCACMGKCGSCLWCVAILVLYIWGIVEMANKPLAPFQDWQGNPIECALVG